MKKRKYKLFSKYSARYNDIVIKCPNCHKQLVIFEGTRKYHICRHCNLKIRDRVWKQSCTTYKLIKTKEKYDETKTD